ncbi:MAG: PIG-L deacetylase family protein, partial [Candidatus Dormibacteraceae bacterium]
MAAKKVTKKAIPRVKARSNSHGPKFERVLVVSAHPDDPEFGAGGSIARLADDGARVTYVIVT